VVGFRLKWVFDDKSLISFSGEEDAIKKEDDEEGVKAFILPLVFSPMSSSCVPPLFYGCKFSFYVTYLPLLRVNYTVGPRGQTILRIWSSDLRQAVIKTSWTDRNFGRVSMGVLHLVVGFRLKWVFDDKSLISFSGEEDAIKKEDDEEGVKAFILPLVFSPMSSSCVPPLFYGCKFTFYVTYLPFLRVNYTVGP
nr:hypothetical protein [Tanacetum cinerariifolium]